MRRLRPIRRRRSREDVEREPDEQHEEFPADDLLPFVPVESAPPEDFAAPVVDEPEEPVRPARVRREASRAGVRFGALLVALVLIAAGVIGTLLNLDRLDLTVPEQWPAGLLALSGVWLVIALNRRNVTSALGAAALAGVAISALLDAQGIAAWRETLIGAVMIALGLGIVLRGLLLRQSAAT